MRNQFDVILKVNKVNGNSNRKGDSSLKVTDCSFKS